MIKKNIKKIILVLLGAVIYILFILYMRPYYKVQDRISKRKEFRYINNEKATGWLRVQGTNIDMAILNYLDMPDVSDPTYNIGWTHNKTSKNDDRILIYSHNVKNVSSKPLIADKSHARFEQLMSFIHYDFAKNNEYIEYTTGNKNLLYKIYSVHLIETDNIDSTEGKMAKLYKLEYIKSAINESYYKYNTDVNKNDKLITLATCTRFYGNSEKHYSFVVEGRRLRKGELVNKYKVRKKKKYDKIVNIMKGER